MTDFFKSKKKQVVLFSSTAIAVGIFSSNVRDARLMIVTALWIRPGDDVPDQHQFQLPRHHGHWRRICSCWCDRFDLLSRLRSGCCILFLVLRQAWSQKWNILLFGHCFIGKSDHVHCWTGIHSRCSRNHDGWESNHGTRSRRNRRRHPSLFQRTGRRRSPWKSIGIE